MNDGILTLHALHQTYPHHHTATEIATHTGATTANTNNWLTQLHRIGMAERRWRVESGRRCYEYKFVLPGAVKKPPRGVPE